VKLKINSIKTYVVETKERPYKIYFGNDIVSKANIILNKYIKNKSIVIIYDKVLIQKLKTLEISVSKAASNVTSVGVNSGENSKSFNNLNFLCEKIIKTGIDRKSILIAFGGGVIGDLTGFVASVLLRGINFIQIPTTMLAQVDSSIGGKTGINSISGKNLIGSFHQPIAVLSDTNILNSLNSREILSGYAELIKHSLIQDKNFFLWLEKNGKKIINGNNKLRTEGIIRACKIKSDIIKNDEFEFGQRALLNLGHTFGHAIESYLKYDGTILHGEAVSIGIIMAFRLAIKTNSCSQKDLDSVTKHFNDVGLPVSLKQITDKIKSPKKIWALMQNDKKSSEGILNFIIPSKIGQCSIKHNISPEIILSLLNEETKK